MKDFSGENCAIEPGTGFITKPGVAALRRTPGKEIEMAPNPNGVPQRLMPEPKNRICDVEPRWGSMALVPLCLGCAVVTATPGFVVKPRWGLVAGSQGVALGYHILCRWHRTFCAVRQEFSCTFDSPQD